MNVTYPLILQMEKLRPRERKGLALSHTACRPTEQDFKPGAGPPNPSPLFLETVRTPGDPCALSIALCPVTAPLVEKKGKEGIHQWKQLMPSVREQAEGDLPQG